MRDIIIQGIGFVAIFVNIIAVQFNKHWQIILLKTVGSILFATHYIFLKAYAGAAMDGIGAIRNIVFIYTVQSHKSTGLWIVLFSLITIGAGIATWADYLSILAIVAKLITTIAYGIDNPHTIRMMNIASSSSWVLYNVINYSIAGVVNEIITIVSIIVAEIRLYYKNKKENKEKDLQGESKNGI